MKKLVFASLSAAMLLSVTACGGGKESTEMADTIIEIGPTTADSLKIALADQDSLLAIITEINDGMNQIKDLEKILSNPGNLGGETSNQRDKIKNDMAAIQESLQQRRQRLEALEKRLAASSKDNEQLQRTINSLKEQIDNQEKTIEDLRTQLEQANTKIAELGKDVDSLNTKVKGVTEERNAAQEKSANLTKELNTCYYAIGSKEELKKHDIIETGFLRKTKIMPSDFQQGYFTKADKTQLTSINTHAKKAKLLTNQPTDSYTFETGANGVQILKITNPSRFWSLSNYLVLQVD